MNPRPESPIDEETARAVRLFTGRVSARHDLADAILFGSRARRGHRSDSDADLAVLLRGKHGSRADVAMELADVAFDVMLETGVLIEAIPFWEDEWAHPERFANPALIANIRRDGVHL